MISPPRGRLAGGLVLTGGALVATGMTWLVRAPEPVKVALPLTLTIVAAGWLLAWFAARGLEASRGTLLVLLAATVLAHLPGSVHLPRTSDDLWRYLWEGHVVLAGENPWRVSPDSPRLDPIGERTTGWVADAPGDRSPAIRSLVGHEEIASIYPPTAMGAFALSAASPHPYLAYKLLLLALALAGVVIVYRVRASTGGGIASAIALGLHPLLVMEGSEGGHLDLLAVPLTLLALAGLDRLRREGLGAPRAQVALLLALTVKPVALALLPRAMLMPAGRPRWPTMAAIGTGLVLLATVAAYFVPPGAARLDPDAAWVRIDDVGTLISDELPDTDPVFTGVAGTAMLLNRGQGEDAGVTAYLDADAARPRPLDERHASHLLGSYLFRCLPGTDRQSGTLIANGIGEVRIETDDGEPLAFTLSLESDGHLTIHAHESATVAYPWFRGILSADRQVLRGMVLRPRGPFESGPAIAIKDAERPFMGYSQFSERWSGRDLLHEDLEEWTGSRAGVRQAAAIGTLLLGLLGLFMPPALTLLLGSAWVISVLPVIHPWYLAWLLAPCILWRHDQMSAWTAVPFLALGAAPLLHL